MLATCWKINGRDGIVLGFTDHVRAFETDGSPTERQVGHA